MVTESRSRPDIAGRADHRPDLTGLRGLAVGSVLLAAAGSGFVPGGFVGVDVFLVVAGFLVTGSLLAEWSHTGQISLAGWYARRVRRALPAATLVLAASLALALACLPRERWSATGWDVLASALHVLNWRLAEQDPAGVAADGFVPDAAASLLANFWLLGVTAQFVLLWPVLMVGVAAWTVHRRSRRPSRPAPARAYPGHGPLLLTAGVLAAGSFAWSVWYTAVEPGRAFVGTTTRIWELALGAGLALLGVRLARLPRLLGTLLGWAGLGTVVAAVLILRPGPELPGHLALLPALGAAAIIAGGGTGRRAGSTGTRGRAAGPGAVAGWRYPVAGWPYRVLGARPLRAVGVLCYPLYLWHWPLLVAAHARFGDLHPAAGLGVVCCAVPLAYLTHRYVETPVRTAAPDAWSPGQVLRIGALLPAAAALGGLLFQLTVWPPSQPAPPPAAAPTSATPSPKPPAAPGAAVLGRSPRNSRAGVPVNQVRSITPSPADATQDLPDVYRHNCFPAATSGVAQSCVYGDRNARFTVALAGDSHAASWVPALQAIAVAKRWRLVTYLKPNCPFLKLAIIAGDERRQDACAEWYDNVRAELTGPGRPGLLVTTGSRYAPRADGGTLRPDAAHQALVKAMRRTWTDLVSTQVPTVVLRDIPILDTDSAKCVSVNPKRLTRCATERRLALAAGAGPAQLAALENLPRVRLIDLTSAICPAERCAPVIGGVLVYRDNQHLTATYAGTLTPRLRSALDRVLTPSAP